MGTRKLDLGEAASLLGVSREAVRRRAKRGTLESERGADGRLYVWVHDDHHTGDGAGHGDDDHDVRDELLEELKDRIRYLEEESRRKDHLLAAALERIPPALEASSDAQESPTEASEGGGEGAVPPEEERRSWWRRWFG